MSNVSSVPEAWPFIQLDLDTAYTKVAMTALVIYDYLLHLDNESSYIWQTNFSFVTGLYIMLRYVGIAYAVYEHSIIRLLTLAENFTTESLFVSHILFVCSETMQVLILLALHSLMIMRLHAMYQRSMKVLVFLIGCFIVEMGIFFSATVFQLLPSSGIVEIKLILSNNSFCSFSSVNMERLPIVDRLNSANVGSILAVEVIMVLLSLYQFTRHIQDSIQGRQGLSRKALTRSAGSFFSILVKDNVLYFLLALSTTSVTLKMNNIPRTTSAFLTVLDSVLEALTLTIIGPHMILSVRHAARSDHVVSGSAFRSINHETREVEMATIRFGSFDGQTDSTYDI
ncbi:hypothetical protein CONPUDRAFT_82934 [Coniophora puteana RWD-64-598 SS2]|uniref:DUF6533 domain-containing protein n=1 Tax=Coniophora puteana (strain RWD-64-598) TaxID=741705 RepID=A0A5M3MKD7_CONPW|nr:uncharacterized protein CONPUDRAFT_82934 [Coniophora puteana RWD-64-598 SS2]EIW79543.1 hypothetical protein CONPUDRAFT_82934 [Coniophora puteana RWD-64-598 SS2]